MAYPDLGPRVGILQRKFKIDTPELAQLLKKEKTTAWRWLQSPHKLSEPQQAALVEAIVSLLKNTNQCSEISVKSFQAGNTLDFCADIGISKVEAATLTNRLVPVPDLLVESIFQPQAKRKGFVGSYLVFRHDKNKERRDRPYTQAHCEITMDAHDRLTYKEAWAGNQGARLNTGFVVTAGIVTNLIGQQNSTDPQGQAEVFWCGLKRIADKEGRATHLYGYLSEVTKSGVLFTDRVVLARNDTGGIGVANDLEGYVTRSRVVNAAGEAMANYLDEWKDSSHKEPSFD
jgi:hypothetical protein